MNAVECRACGAVFDLSAQWYFDDLCPSCKVAESGDEAPTRPVCCCCQERYDSGDGLTAQVQNRGQRGGTERVGVCSSTCKTKLERRRRCS